MAKNILITGANGQLGSEFRTIAKKSYYNFIFTDYKELDITKQEDVDAFFAKNTIDYLVNCAAYTAVDKAESETEKATLINKQGVKVLSEVCNKYSTKFITISTDYVYSGEGYMPYTEEDTPNPKSAYGKTKLEGEKEALKHSNSLVIRTSWLYSVYGNNFVKTMIKLGQERDELNIVYDQIGTPTYAGDLAEAIIKIIDYSENNKFVAGIFNFSNEGVTSWYDFATSIFKSEKIKCKTNPILTKEYPTPATRPHYSVMDKAKIKKTFNIEIPHWQDSLNKCLSLLKKV